MFLTPLVFLALAASAGPSARPPRGEGVLPTEKAVHVGALWVRADHLDFEALRADLGLRLADADVVSFHQPRPASAGLVIFVDVTPAPMGSERLTLVVSDGRAYDRTIAPDANESPVEHRQLIARSIASLVDGVEAGTEPPDRDGVPLPEPEPASPIVCPEPPVTVCPDCVEDRPESPKGPPPRLEFGPSFGVGTLVGLGPPADTDRFAAFTGDLGLSFRWRRGPILVAAARAGGRTHALGSSLVRVRAAIGGGYGFRPSNGRVEIDTLAGASVEPWFVFREGSRVSFGSDARPAIGAWARVGLGYRIETTSNVVVRVGSWVEFAASYVPSSNGPIARVSGLDGDAVVPMFRVGGPELGFGLATTIWFGRP